MTIYTLPVGELATNCYLVADESGCAAVIDPGDEAARILEYAAARGLKIEAVLLTHLHIDHFAAVPPVLAASGATLILPRAEEPALRDDLRSLMMWLPATARFTLSPDRLVEEGDTVRVGTLCFTFWHTPGHTGGSGCWRCGDALFCGDTLFAGSAGRTDLPSGDTMTLRRSLRRLADCPEDLRLFPGHGEATTLAAERRYNPFLK